MASPLAQGLFAHAIGESGAAFPGQRGEGFRPLADAEKLEAASAATAFWDERRDGAASDERR